MRKLLLCILLLSFNFSAFCQWNGDPAINNTVINTVQSDYSVGISTDAASGAIVLSQGEINGNIYVQKITATGTIAWGGTTNPVPICVSNTYKGTPFILPDGIGGAFIAWSDYRFNTDKGEIFVQRVNDAGAVQWTTNGIRVTNTATADDQDPVLCSDGAGGVILSWYADDNINKDVQAYAQRYNGAGVVQWSANGVQVCAAPGFRGANAIVSDSRNGAIIFFLDTRNDSHGLDYDYLNNDDNELVNSDLYAQRLNGSGSRVWADNGVAVVTAPGNQIGIERAIADGAGGAIIAFNDDRSGTSDNIYAQRISTSGAAVWKANGIPVTTEAGAQVLMNFVSDGSSGLVAVYKNDDSKLLVQRANSAGVVSWAAGGITLTADGENVMDAFMTPDGAGNTILTYDLYQDVRTIRGQKISAAGALQWGPGGVVVASNGSPFNAKVVSGDNGGVIVAWNATTTGNTLDDVFASKILTNGTLAGTVASGYITVANGNWNNPASWLGGVVPPAGAAVTIHHTISCNVNASCSSVKVETAAGKLTVLTGFKITITD